MTHVNRTVLRLSVAAAVAMTAVLARAYTQVVDGIEWSYVLNAGSATIIDPSCRSAIPVSTSGAITIPSKLGGYPVTCIGDLAFVACGKRRFRGDERPQRLGRRGETDAGGGGPRHGLGRQDDLRRHPRRWHCPECISEAKEIEGNIQLKRESGTHRLPKQPSRCER